MICARASINADTGASLFYISFAEAEYSTFPGFSLSSYTIPWAFIAMAQRAVYLLVLRRNLSPTSNQLLSDNSFYLQLYPSIPFQYFYNNIKVFLYIMPL